MRYLVLFLVAGAGLSQAPSGQAPSAEVPSQKSIGTMSELMVDMIFPLSNEIFYVGRGTSRKPRRNGLISRTTR